MQRKFATSGEITFVLCTATLMMAITMMTLYSNADDGHYDDDHLTHVTFQVTALKQRELDPNSVTPI